MYALPALLLATAVTATQVVPALVAPDVEGTPASSTARGSLAAPTMTADVTNVLRPADESAQMPLALIGAVGSVETYCDATPNTFGTIALIDCTGSFDVRVQTFGLRVFGAPPVATSFGMFTCGQTQTNIPFGNGYLCISPFAPGILRMRMQSLAVGPVSKTMETNADEFAMCEPGSAWNFQFWYRNPAAGAITFNTSDAIHVQFAP